MSESRFKKQRTRENSKMPLAVRVCSTNCCMLLVSSYQFFDNFWKSVQVVKLYCRGQCTTTNRTKSSIIHQASLCTMDSRSPSPPFSPILKRRGKGVIECNICLVYGGDTEKNLKRNEGPGSFRKMLLSVTLFQIAFQEHNKRAGTESAFRVLKYSLKKVGVHSLMPKQS